MKNLKKIIAMGLTAALCAVSLAGCGGTQNGGTDGATDTKAKDTYKIGVLQYADHPSLDNCREGFLEGHEIECPFHQGRFDVRTGEATLAPCAEPIRSYPVKVEAGRVWIRLQA